MNLLFSLCIGAALLVALPSCSSGRKDLPPTDDPSAPRDAPSKREYVGLSRRDAALKAWAAGQSFRVVEIDGERAREEGPRERNSINFTIEKGVVVKVTNG